MRMNTTNEEIDKLKKIDLVFLANHLGFTPVKKSSNFYTLEEHDSFMIKIRTNTFQWYSRGNYGNAISMCMYLGAEVDKRFQSYSYSINYLKNLYLQMNDNIIIDNMQPHKNIKKNLETLKLPFPANNNKKVYSYLENRCISKEIIDYFIYNKWVYQNRYTDNLVFVSYKSDKPVFVCEKGIIKEQRFMKEYCANDYDYCFYIDHGSNSLIVTEAIVDMMSIMELVDDFKSYNYLSINSVTKYQAIFEHIKNDPKIKNVLMRVDHDEAGIKLNEKVCSILKEEFPYIRISVQYPIKEKDWNDYLVYEVNKREKVDAYTIIF